MPCSARQRVVRGVGVLVGKHVEVQPFGCELACDAFQGLDLGRGQPKPAETVGACLAQFFGIEWIERSVDAGPDRRRARGRKLLSGDDVRKTGETWLAPPQRRHSCQFEHRLEPRIIPEQGMNGVFEIGLGVEVDEHCDLNHHVP